MATFASIVDVMTAGSSINGPDNKFNNANAENNVDVNACFWVKAKVAIGAKMDIVKYCSITVRFKFANSLLFLASESYLSIGVSITNNLILLIDVNISL